MQHCNIAREPNTEDTTYILLARRASFFLCTRHNLFVSFVRAGLEGSQMKRRQATVQLQPVGRVIVKFMHTSSAQASLTLQNR
jgi:hypothetical protein